MITLEQLIINEMKDVLGHEPTQEEIKSLSEYLADKNIKSLVELESLISIDWKHLFTTECAWCGDRFLTETMINTDVKVWFCSDQCKRDYEEEHGSTATDAMPLD